MADLLFRGRGADVGARAPGWLVRLCGAALAFAIYTLADALGLWEVIGVPNWARLLVPVLGAVLASTRAGTLLWMGAGALTTVSFIVSYTPLVKAPALSFIRADAVSASEIPDAIVVLSGGMTHEGRLTGPALDRLLTGIAEARSRGVHTLALSVVTRKLGRILVSSEPDQRALVALAAPELDLRLVYDVHSTRDEALKFAAMARTHQWRRVMLVTSPLHSRRACATVEMAGLPVECRPAQARTYSISRLDLPENRRRVFADVMYEVAAGMLYAARGWIP
jgi:uncharacterized SAM-binding protein YcdF (DUF218 family)